MQQRQQLSRWQGRGTNRTLSVFLQAITTAAWTALCLLMVAQSSRHLQPAAVQLLWTFFQPAGPMLLMLVLYARAVAYFEQHHIPHEECYSDNDRRFLASSRDLFSLARVLACFAAACLAASAALCAAGGHAATAAAIVVPPLMYSTAAALMLMPVNAFVRQPSRVFFCRTLGRVLIPTRPVSWADFLLADILTSLAKSSSDLSRSTCLILHGEWVSKPAVAACHAVAPAVASCCTLRQQQTPVTAVCARQLFQLAGSTEERQHETAHAAQT
jgi:hypothetical protein